MSISSLFNYIAYFTIVPVLVIFCRCCDIKGFLILISCTVLFGRWWMGSEVQKAKVCFRPVSNRGPFACEANVITTTLRKL